MKKPSRRDCSAWGLVLGGGLVMVSAAQAGMVKDAHGNVGYDTAAECDAAVTGGTARFYQPFTSKPPLKLSGEADVKPLTLRELVAAQQAASRLGYDSAGYARGACDLGVARSGARDGVSGPLVGKYVPYGPEMSVNAYFDAQNQLVRATMQQCDNHFGQNLPRPVGTPRVAAATSECFATVLIPAKFETRTEQVVKVPETKRFEVVPATFKTVAEQVLVSPEYKRQIPVPATYKTTTEVVVIKPAGTRDEPVPPSYKTVTEQVVAKPASVRFEVVPATFKTVTERVMITPERKELKVVPAVYGDSEETVVDRPATVRVETIPATFKTETESVLAKAESLRYEPIALPLRRVSEEMVRSEASARLEASQATYRTVTDRVLVKEASKRLVEVPAVFETVTERVKVAEASKEWKRGRVWIGKAIDVRPLRNFVPGTDGRVGGHRVDGPWVAADNTQLDDDVMCLVEVPERYDTITRQVLKSAATVREVEVPAEYAEVTRQVLDGGAKSREVEIPATYQTVTRQEIDTDKLRAQGYKFNEQGDIVATPTGERVLRAAAVVGAAGAAKTAGAQSGEEAYVREIKVPAQYHSITRQVVDKPATVRTVEVPGTVKTVKSRVVVTPARTEELVTPATYKTITRQVIDTPATQREIAIPAVYAKVERRVVDTPASVRQIPVPAVTDTLKRQVVDTPASFREEVVPAVYKTETRKVVDQPASTREVVLPAQMETLSYQVKVSEASTQRRSILCETNATPARIAEIQRALHQAGFDPGPVDGVIRAQTMNAVNRYQQAKGLPVDGYLNLETVKSLGVSPN